MMKSGIIWTVFATLLFTSQIAQAEPTVARKIESMDLQGSDGGVIVRGIGAWGIYCGGTIVNAVYFSKTTVQAYNEMLTMTMGAYTAGKSVRFYGGCSSNAGIYNGTYLIVSD